MTSTDTSCGVVDPPVSFVICPARQPSSTTTRVWEQNTTVGVGIDLSTCPQSSIFEKHALKYLSSRPILFSSTTPRAVARIHRAQPQYTNISMAPKYALSDSESELEADTPNVPSDTTLEQALRDEVTSRFKTGRREEITVKRVRLAVEEELKLEAGFFRATGNWKEKSEEIIRNQVVRLLQLSSGLYHSDRDDKLTCDSGDTGPTRRGRRRRSTRASESQITSAQKIRTQATQVRHFTEAAQAPKDRDSRFGGRRRG